MRHEQVYPFGELHLAWGAMLTPNETKSTSGVSYGATHKRGEPQILGRCCSRTSSERLDYSAVLYRTQDRTDSVLQVAEAPGGICDAADAARCALLASQSGRRTISDGRIADRDSDRRLGLGPRPHGIRCRHSLPGRSSVATGRQR